MSLADLARFHLEEGMILANTISIGMQPNIDETPIPKVHHLAVQFFFSYEWHILI